MATNRIAIVTGANKGLGLALVQGLCQKFQGTVYLTSRDEKRGQGACDDLRSKGLNPTYHQLDITDRKSIATFSSHIKDKEIEILINNAGILFLKDSKEPKAYQAEQTVLVNFFALVDFCEAMLPFIKKGAKILNITSSSGHLSRIPSEELRRKFSDRSLSLDGLKYLMTSYVEAAKRNQDLNEGWGDSSYVVSKVGVNAYTFLLHRRLASEGIFCFILYMVYYNSSSLLKLFKQNRGPVFPLHWGLVGPAAAQWTEIGVSLS